MDLNQFMTDGRGKSETLLGAINELSTKLENDHSIHPAFQTDIFAMLTATVGLCTLLASPQYSIDAIMSQSSSMLQALSAIIGHAASARTSVGAWLVKKSGTQDYLLEALTDQATAERKAEHYTNITGLKWEAVAVILTENTILRPAPTSTGG